MSHGNVDVDVNVDDADVNNDADVDGGKIPVAEKVTNSLEA